MHAQSLSVVGTCDGLALRRRPTSLVNLREMAGEAINAKLVSIHIRAYVGEPSKPAMKINQHTALDRHTPKTEVGVDTSLPIAHDQNIIRVLVASVADSRLTLDE